MSYQYKSSLFYSWIHLLRFIGFYCTSIYKKYVILLCFIFNHHKTFLISKIIITKLCLSHKFQINSFLVFSKAIFCCIKLNQPPSKSFDYPDAENIVRRPHRANIERRGSVGVWMIVVRDITTLI